MEATINVTVLRQVGGDGDQEGEKKTYTVPFEKGMTVLNALEYLYRNHSVAYRHSCDIGLCTICTMRVNGKPQMVCKIILNEPMDLEIEPPRNYPVLRDLVGDFDQRKQAANE